MSFHVREGRHVLRPYVSRVLSEMNVIVSRLIRKRSLSHSHEVAEKRALAISRRRLDFETFDYLRGILRAH